MDEIALGLARTMKPRKVITILFFLLSLFSKAELPKDPAEYAIWENKILRAIENLDKTPDEEAIPKLGRLVIQTSPSWNQGVGSPPVYNASKNALMSRPAYAEYFGNLIRAITDAEIAGTSEHHSSERWWQYETLQQLPGPETVKVLGELLFDEKGQKFTDDPVRDAGVAQANCRYAAKSMAILIDKPPYDPKLFPDSDSALDAWRLWYQQVKAGTRTFCFKGSTVAYTLNGPATDSPQASRLNSRSQPETPSKAVSSPNGDIAAVTPEKSPWPKIAAGIAALLALLGGWLAFRKRKIPA